MRLSIAIAFKIRKSRLSHGAAHLIAKYIPSYYCVQFYCAIYNYSPLSDKVVYFFLLCCFIKLSRIMRNLLFAYAKN